MGQVLGEKEAGVGGK